LKHNLVPLEIVPNAEHVLADRPEYEDRNHGLDRGNQPTFPTRLPHAVIAFSSLDSASASGRTRIRFTRGERRSAIVKFEKETPQISGL
jgi:hypothetical protein